MKRYMRRKKYQELTRMVARTTQEDDENETILMLEECRTRRRGMIKCKVKVSPKIGLPAVKPLRKWRDAYVESMLSFAGHVAQLNNGNVHLFKRIPKPKANSQCFEDN